MACSDICAGLWGNLDEWEQLRLSGNRKTGESRGEMMRKRKGFTLIELLTVIAIIAILSAVIFPVYARTKVSANKGADISSLNDLRNALTLYRVDQGGYPPALLGYVSTYSGDPQGTDVIPANSVQSFLYPKRIGSMETFRPRPVRFANNIVTNAVWPAQDPRAVGSAPILDLNGDGLVNNLDDPANARQAYGPTDGFVTQSGLTSASAATAARFYRISGYDVAEVKSTTGPRIERRYTLFWTMWSVRTDVGLGAGNATDDPRQLGYSEPPDNTVVTWNSFYRSYDSGGNTLREKNDIVLFLGGAARSYDSRNLHERAYRVTP